MRKYFSLVSIAVWFLFNTASLNLLTTIYFIFYNNIKLWSFHIIRDIKMNLAYEAVEKNLLAHLQAAFMFLLCFVGYKYTGSEKLR